MLKPLGISLLQIWELGPSFRPLSVKKSLGVMVTQLILIQLFQVRALGGLPTLPESPLV